MKITTRITEITEDIEYRFQNFMSSLRNIKTGVKSLWNWKKIIYNDRWWDYGFFDAMVKFKLQDLYCNWDSAHYVGSEIDKAEIKKLIDILERINYLETQVPTDIPFAEQDKEIKRLYSKFGWLLYAERDILHKGDGEKIEDRMIKTNLIQKLWD